jgi:geranylgeranyl transferase type-2 subunit alpha
VYLPTDAARELWQGELKLVGKMLTLDNRNFHGWSYRRTVVDALQSKELSLNGPQITLVEEEFDYTTRMIRTSMSNFSAWHRRSKLIPILLEERKAGSDERRKMLDDGLI